MIDSLVGALRWSFVPIITALFFLFCLILFSILRIIYGFQVCSFFYGCVKLWFPDIEVNPGPRAVPNASNVNCLHGNRDKLGIAATKFDVAACAETKVTGRRHVSDLLFPSYEAPTLLLRGARLYGLDMALFVSSNLSVCNRKGSSVLVVSSLLLKFLVNG